MCALQSMCVILKIHQMEEKQNNLYDEKEVSVSIEFNPLL